MPDTNEMPVRPAAFPWLRCVGIAAAVVLVALVGLRLAWGSYWDNRLEETLQAIRDRGEPIDLADFEVPRLPYADNGLNQVSLALDRWPRVPGTGELVIEHGWDRDTPAGPGNTDPIADNAAYLDACGPALALIDQALAAPGYHWELALASPLVIEGVFGESLSELRTAARLMEDAAHRAVAAGRPGLALELTRKIYALSAACDAPPVTLIQQLVGISVRSTATRLVEELLPRIGPETPGARDALRRLLAALDRGDAGHRAFRQAFYFERLFLHDTARAFVSGAVGLSDIGGRGGHDWLGGRGRRVLQGPLFLRDGQIGVEEVSAYLDALAHSHHADFQAALATQIDPAARLARAQSSWSYPLSAVVLSTFEAPVQTYFRSLAQDRMARTAVALKLHLFEHGRVAGRLDDLVPLYLDGVPVDPLDPGHGLLRYRPEGVVPGVDTHGLGSQDGLAQTPPSPLPVLYSVGVNAVDDGGYLLLDVDGTLVDHARYQAPGGGGPTDQWFLLAPAPTPLPDEPADGGGL